MVGYSTRPYRPVLSYAASLLDDTCLTRTVLRIPGIQAPIISLNCFRSPDPITAQREWRPDRVTQILPRVSPSTLSIGQENFTITSLYYCLFLIIQGVKRFSFPTRTLHILPNSNGRFPQ